MLPAKDKRPPYPLTRDEQGLLFQELPDYLARMGLFKVNTGLREQEVCGLKWTDEVEVPELSTSVFIIEGDKVKNEEDRLVVLNRVARSVIDSVRGQHPEYVFAAELANLIAAAEKVCEENSRKSPAITLLRRRAG